MSKYTSPNGLVDTNEATMRMGLKNPKTLANWRRHEFGPAYHRVGRFIRYSVADIEEWLRNRRVDCSQGSPENGGPG